MSAAVRTLLYAWVPEFYAAVERARSPELRARPVVVGGDPRKRGKVQSASPDALAHGVRLGMPVLEALERCPRARAVRTDMATYRDAAVRLRALLRDEVAALEAVGLDAAFLDATGEARAPVAIARSLRARVDAEFGLDLRVGISALRFLARLAAERADDGGLLEVAPGSEVAFLAPLPVGALPGVGPRTLEALCGLGAKSVGDLHALDPLAVERALGNHGLQLLRLAQGRDDQPVRARPTPRSIGREHTFREPRIDLAAIADQRLRLAAALAGMLREQGLGAQRVALKVRYEDGESVTRSATLSSPVRTAAEIDAAAERLQARTHAGSRPLRLLGLRLGGLAAPSRDDRQLDLFDDA